MMGRSSSETANGNVFGTLVRCYSTTMIIRHILDQTRHRSGNSSSPCTLISLDFNLVFVDSKLQGSLGLPRHSNTSSGQSAQQGDAVVYNPDGDGLYDTADVVAFRHHSIPQAYSFAQTSVTLAPGAQQVVSLTWDPGSLPRGYYTIFGAVPPSLESFRSDQQRRILPINFLQKFKETLAATVKSTLSIYRLSEQPSAQASAGQHTRPRGPEQ